MTAGLRISMRFIVFIVMAGRLVDIAVAGKWLERPIGENGDQLRFGELPKEKCFPGKVKVESVICRPYVTTWADQKEFQTTVYKLQGNASASASVQVQVQVPEKDYFFALKRDLWGCTATEYPSNKIWRMEVELMGIREIANVQYDREYDVRTKYYLSDAKHKRRTAWLEGGTYFNKTRNANGDYKIVRCRYEGERTIEGGKTGPQYFVIDGTDRTKTEFKHELKGSDHAMEGLSTNTHLPTIWIGKQFNKYKKNPKNSKDPKDLKRNLGTEKTKARCSREQGVKPTPKKFHTKVKLKTERSKGSRPIWKSLAEKEQLEYIIPLKQQVWKCKVYSEDASVIQKRFMLKNKKEKETYTFYRIVNEMVSRVPLHMVQFGFTVVEAFQTNLPLDLDTTDQIHNIGFRCTEIVYRFPMTLRSMNYHGSLELLEDDVSREQLQREVSYNLQPKVVYETFIGKRGFDLRVGSRLVGFGQDGNGRIGSSNTMAKCENIENVSYNKAFDTQIKLVTSIGNEAFGTSRIKKYMQPEYYKYIDRTVANCSSIEYEKDKQEKHFIRIKNIIEILVAVRTIQTYDTVSVAFSSRPNNEKAVRIVEIKYLDPDYDYSVGRYDGKIFLSSEALKVLNPRNNSFQEVKRTHDDFTRLVGPYQWGPLALRYFAYSNTEYQGNVGEGTYDLTIGSKGSNIPTMEGLTETSVARCFSIPGRTDIQEYTQFTLTSIERRSKTRFGKKTADEGVKVQDFIGFERERLWKCTVHETTPANKHFTFYFVKNEVNITDNGLSKLHYVYYYNGDRIFRSISEDGRERYQIRRYYFLDKIDGETTTPPKVIKYSGHIVMEDKRKDTSLFKSGTEQIMEKSNVLKRVNEEQSKYQLRSEEFMYRTVIDDTGRVTLKLGGTRWERIMPSHITNMQCVEKQTRELQGREFSIHDFEHFNTFFRTEVSEVGGSENVFDNYFESLKQEYWECTPKSVSTGAREEDRNMKMIRIVNQFSVRPHHCDTIKEMHHYDGFTFMMGEAEAGKPACMEINEIKYLRELRAGECEKERVGELIVTKYEGRITLIDSRTGNELPRPKVTAVRLKNVARKDIMYLLPENRGKTVFRKVLGPHGIVVAIGTPPPKYDSVENSLTTRFFKCVEITEEDEKFKISPLLDIRAILLEDGSMNLDPKTMGVKKDFFDIKMTYQKCSARRESFYRMRHLYTLKDNMEVSSVLHTDEVKVYASNANNRLQIEHIVHYDRKFNQFKFDGFIVSADELFSAGLQHSKDVEFSSDLIHYWAYTMPAIQAYYIAGVYLEVGSPYAYEVTSGEDDVAICYKHHESYVSKPDEAFSMRIFSRRNILEDKRDSYSSKFDGFVIIKQEIYACSTVMSKEFYRVENEIIDASMIRIHGIYHHDGITIMRQTYPPGYGELDVSSSIRIIEVKYLQRNANNVYKVVRYDGKIRVVSEIDENIITWFQMPSVLQEYSIEAGYNASEAKIRREHNYWSIEVLKALALKQRPESFNEQLPYPNFPRTTIDNQRVLAKVIPGKNKLRFLIGTPWEIYRNEPDKALRCILDEWNPRDFFQFSTDAVLYVMDESDEKIHNYLDEETILDYFKLNKLEVWICVNKIQETFLRVVTELVGIVPIQLIKHYDSVKVESVEITGEYGEKRNTAKITETKMVDANTLKTVRYDGLVKLLPEKYPPQPQTSFMGWAKRRFGKIVARNRSAKGFSSLQEI